MLARQRNAISEFLSILGEPRRHRSAEDLLEAAVDRLLTTGRQAEAAAVYGRNYESVVSWRDRGGVGGDDPDSYAAVGAYSRESACGADTRALPLPQAYKRPAGPTVAEQTASGAAALVSADRRRRREAAALVAHRNTMRVRREFVRLFATAGAGSRLGRKFAAV